MRDQNLATDGGIVDERHVTRRSRTASGHQGVSRCIGRSADSHRPVPTGPARMPLAEPRIRRVWQGRFAALAQLVEHIIRNDGVAGSNPACGTSQPNNSCYRSIGSSASIVAILLWTCPDFVDAGKEGHQKLTALAKDGFLGEKRINQS